VVEQRNPEKKEETKVVKPLKIRWIHQSLGISKQAYYQRIKAGKIKAKRNERIMDIVKEVRKTKPKTGTVKLYVEIKPKLIENNIKLGRDALHNLLKSKGMLIKRSKRFHITTDSNHFFYTSPNLIKDLTIEHSEQAFACDITYIKLDWKHAYLALIIDLYSKKIMGYALDDNMKVDLVKRALKMAKQNCIHKTASIVHHSDRGKQYCCPDYTNYAKKMGFVMSTTQNSDPYENAVAERINGIMKYEFGLGNTIPNLRIAQAMIKQAVEIYNNDRIHWSLDLKTPQEVHLQYNKQEYKSYKKLA
jgi:putative transposase